MLDINSLTLVASFLLPILVDVVIRVFHIDSAMSMKIVAIVLSLIVAVISEFTANPVQSWQDLLGRFTIVFGVSQIVYRNIYKDTSLNNTITGTSGTSETPAK